MQAYPKEKQHTPLGSIISIIGVGVFSIWNSENTLYHSKAFFLVFLPVTMHLRDGGLWQDEDVALVQDWLDDLNSIGYKFPKMSDRDDIIREQLSLRTNCRPAHVSLQVTESSDRSQRKLDFYQDLLDWCDATGTEEFCSLMPSHSIHDAHRNRPALSEKLDTVLIITNNYPWKMGIGLLQRIYQPYFGMTIFCGTWDRRLYKDNGSFPDIVHPFNFVHLSKSEMAKGALSYYCLTKVAELRLQNTKGYFVQSDDTVFNFWKPLKLDKVIHPYGISYLGRPGKQAARRVLSLFSKKYRHHMNTTVWEEYKHRLYEYDHITDAAQNLMADDGWIQSDFYFIPQKEVQFFASLTEVFFKAGLFIEVAMNKYIRSVASNSFCSTIIRTMGKALVCSSDEHQQRPVKNNEKEGKK
ncbi:hypothetical protein ANCCEY_08390 [Ancylostoma ceylanicum]|uniref:Uncharacterized protein n=1 Tax=Ancylostoma ceylanicum TaxID=53326 RepID=A0A0D6LKN2_9BILA|nr:hypothetical protein ANCCEY_08390 [Ancylostoma ceylanicum]